MGEIRLEIESSGGRITFARFMELALYHPRLGYYTGGRERVGKSGDYFTSVSVGPLFGRILAKQFLKFREELGNPAEFEVVEFGGHRGQLKEDVLAAAPDLKYRVVEVGDPLPHSIVGCVFSNEFLDALPVHVVQVKDGKWQEVYVQTNPSPEPSPRKGRTKRDAGATTGSPLPAGGEDQGEGASFEEVLGPLSTPRLAEYLSDLPVQHMEGYRTEVNLRALDWLEDVANRLRRGWIVTIDYGWEQHEYFAPHHRDGTLLCYHQHTKSANPYAHIGEQDITAHVEFTSLIEFGKKLGLETVTFTDQSHYLLQIGEAEITEIVERTAGQPSKERAAIKQLIHPEMMGTTFRVLVQGKS
ncbi:MAG TPA: SAM-dependent methyltransferase [Verrucomicrobiae bacterium]|nr:SAM-dependent methyltransferase [Verrucomicrobiae bacterium]